MIQPLAKLLTSNPIDFYLEKKIGNNKHFFPGYNHYFLPTVAWEFLNITRNKILDVPIDFFMVKIMQIER